LAVTRALLSNFFLLPAAFLASSGCAARNVDVNVADERCGEFHSASTTRPWSFLLALERAAPLKRTILGADKSNVGQFNKSADQGRRNLAWQMPLDCHFEFGHFGTIGLLKLILFQPSIVRTCGPIQTAGGRFRQLMDSL
jgi:hypothetical protein